MKVGIIRCMQAEKNCSGDLERTLLQDKGGVYRGHEEEITLVGMANCGGCPGENARYQAKKLVEQGADTIAFASCIKMGAPGAYSCPYAPSMQGLTRQELGKDIRIFDHTHTERK